MPAEQLLLINPRRKRRAKKSRRRRARSRRRVVSHRRRRRVARVSRRRSRRVGGYRIRRRRAKNPRRHRSYKMRRRRHRNPIGLSSRGITATVVPAAIGAVGAVGLDVAWGYLSGYLPASLQSGVLGTVAKIAGAFGLGMVAGKVVGREKGKLVTAGAITVIAYGAIKEFAHSAAPSIPGLGAYMPGMGMSGFGDLAATNPAPYLSGPAGMGAYMRPATMGSLRCMGGGNAAGDGMFD